MKLLICTKRPVRLAGLNVVKVFNIPSLHKATLAYKAIAMPAVTDLTAQPYVVIGLHHTDVFGTGNYVRWFLATNLVMPFRYNVKGFPFVVALRAGVLINRHSGPFESPRGSLSVSGQVALTLVSAGLLLSF